MLDVITTVSESTPKQFVIQCRRSIVAAAALCDFPVSIIESPGVPGNIGKAMHDSLARARSDFVCWVDDDDFLLPNALSCLRSHFAMRPAAICAREVQLLANGKLMPTAGRHHLSAWRRDVIDAVPLRALESRPYKELFAEAAKGVIVDEFSWVYIYRIRRSPALRLRANNKVR